MPGGRPALSPGTYGEISCQQVGPSNYKARARFKDWDGMTRTVSRFGQTKDAAKRSLREALSKRAKDGRVDRDTTVREVSRLWLAEIDASSRALGTKQHYSYAVDRYVLPHFGTVRVREVDAGVADRGLKKITTVNGPAAAKTARAALNGVFGVAVRYGAVTANPVRETAAISSRRKLARALAPEQDVTLGEKLRDEDTTVGKRAVAWDLPDLADWMLATGCRIGEALAAYDGVNEDGEPLLDLEAGTWEINATAVRLKGDCLTCTHGLRKHPQKAGCTECGCEAFLKPPTSGMVIQLRPKTAAGWRRIPVPGFAVDLMRARRQRRGLQPDTVRLLHDDGKLSDATGLWVAFPAPQSKMLRDPSNTQSDLREVLDSIDCDACSNTGYQINDDGTFVVNAKGHKIRCKEGPWSWVSSHTFRKTVATRLFKAGLDDAAVADHLGHSEPSMTNNVYAGRRVVNPGAAKILDRKQ